MGLFDNFRGLTGGSRRIGLELGRRVVAVEVKGTPPEVVAAGQSTHAGYSGEELGGWLKRWLETVGTSAKKARVVVTDGGVHHYLVSMPEMSDSERYLAAGAEIRKLAPVPTSQVAYSHQAVSNTEGDGDGRQRVLISAVDKSTLRNAVDAVEAAGMTAEIVTTVPAALARAARLMPSTSGGMALAWLSSGRCYLLVFHDGGLELVRDFALRDVQADVDAEGTAAAVSAELRRSFLYFGQRVKGAQVDRLVLAGPMPGLRDLGHRLRDTLGIRAELFDVAGQVNLGSRVDPEEQPAFATALGAVALEGTASANLVPPEEMTEERVRRFLSRGGIVAAAILILLLGLGAFALLSAGVQEGRLEGMEQRLTAARAELQQTQAVQQERAAHQERRALLENRALESTLIGALLQRISQRIPDAVALERIEYRRVTGPQGQPYWDAQIDGLVLGASRSESQAVFNRFWTLLVNDPLVHDMHLVESLVIGVEEARVPSERTTAVREGLRGPRVIPRDARASARRGRPDAAAGAEFFEGPALASGVEYLERQQQPGSVIVRTTLDDLAPFGPTETSVGFKVAIQLKAIETGAGR